MAVHIRLRKIGKNPRKKFHFRISVFDQRRARDGRCIEEIGYYDPKKKPLLFKINKARYDFWISRGAKPSETVSQLIKNMQGGA